MQRFLLTGAVDIVEPEDLATEDDARDDVNEAVVNSRSALSVFSFTLRTRVGSNSVFKGPWAVFPLSEMSPANRSLVEKELTLRPFTMIAGVRKLLPAVRCHRINESSRLMLVPRAYFMDRFGAPALDETCLGQPIHEDVTFSGQLRDERQKSFVAALVGTMLEQKKTIALGSAEPGCGKTVMFLYLWSVILRRKCLVVVHGLPIVAQWIAAARRFCPASKIGIIHQNTWQIRNRDIVIASSDTVAARADQFTKDMWHEFGVVCFDEAHHIMASTFLNIYLNCMHARYCVSLTGTPYRKDGLTHAMAYMTGPNAATMKNTDPVHVRIVQFAGGLRSFVAHKYGPGKGKPNEAAMLSAFVEDGVRTCLLARIIRACVLRGRKCLVLCARNELRQAIRMLVQESFQPTPQFTPTPTPTPHTYRPLAISAGASSRGSLKNRVLDLVDTYDAIWLEPYRVVPSGSLERADMVRKMKTLEQKIGTMAAADADADTPWTVELASSLRGGVVVPKVVPDLHESEEPVAASWVEELNAGDDYLARQNKYHARAILATYVMAREALDVPGLDTLILATPSSDVRQAVGRIRRTGRGGQAGPDHSSASSILDTPHALVIDLVDMFVPFQRWGDVRAAYYRTERFATSTVRVVKDTDVWDAV